MFMLPPHSFRIHILNLSVGYCLCIVSLHFLSASFLQFHQTMLWIDYGKFLLGVNE